MSGHSTSSATEAGEQDVDLDDFVDELLNFSLANQSFTVPPFKFPVHISATLVLVGQPKTLDEVDQILGCPFSFAH